MVPTAASAIARAADDKSRPTMPPTIAPRTFPNMSAGGDHRVLSRMTAQLIDGKALAAKVRDSLKEKAQAIAKGRGYPPGIAVVRVGEDPASKIYVTSKKKTAEELGFGSWEHHLDAGTSQADLLALVAKL